MNLYSCVAYIEFIELFVYFQLVQTLMTTCYKSIKNHILRAAAEKKQNHIVMDKIMKVNRLTQLASQNMASQDAIEEVIYFLSIRLNNIKVL